MNKVLSYTIVLLFAMGTSLSSFADGREYRNGRGGGGNGGGHGGNGGGGHGGGGVGPSRPNRGPGPGNVGPSRPNRPDRGPGPGNVGPSRPNRPDRGPGPGNVGPSRPNRPDRGPGPGNVGPSRPDRGPGYGGRGPNRPDRGPGPGYGGRGPNRPDRGPGPGYGGRGPNRPDRGPGYGGGRPIPDRWNTYHNRYGSREGWNFGRDYRYSRYNHSPYRNIPRGHYTYHSPRDFFRTVPYRNIYWNHWLRWRVNYANGYYWSNDYPWFVYNGFQHRYSDQDVCNYELVDGRANQTMDTFYGQYCNVGYDRCAQARDNANYQAGEYRYFCSEKVEEGEDYNWDYNDDFYSDVGNDQPYYNDEF
jgi:hypothetical protein